MNGISVVLPAYQEEENLKHILPKLNETLTGLDYEILVIDTIEPLDETKKVCEDNNCRYIARESGNAYGDAIRTGFLYAEKKFTVIMDADGSHNPKDILKFYEVMKKNEVDLVIGSRYCKGGKTANSFILRLMSKTLNVAYKIVFHLSVQDVSDSFRMYKSEQIKNIKLECDNFDIVEEILILLNIFNNDYKVKEIPIYFDKRAAGVSKRNLFKFILSYISTMRCLIRIQNKAKRTIK